MPEVHFFSMSQSVYQEAGSGLPVSYAMVDTPYGSAFFAESCGRVIFLSLMEDEEQGLKEFTKLWSQSKPSLQPERCQNIISDIFSEDGEARLLALGTNFQIDVWEALIHVEEGSLSSYKDIAQKIGHPGAENEVAKAVSDNPIAHLIPCHRAVLSDNSLGDYRWGIESKRSFLQAEGIDLEQLSLA